MRNRKLIRTLWLLGTIIGLSNFSAINLARSEDTGKFIERMAKERIQLYPDYAIVTWGAVASPLGRFLLIRRGNGICAVKFKNFIYKIDKRPPTMFDTRSDVGSAEYDWYFQNNVSDGFTDKYVKKGNGTVSVGPLVGVGRLAFQTRNRKIICGPFNLVWHYPDIVNLYSGNKSIDQGIEMAPTRWLNIKDVKWKDSNLVWFRLDESRKINMFLIDNLKSPK